MKKGVIVVMLLFFLLAVSMVFSANHIKNENNDKKVDKEVNELLKENDEVSVIVVLKDDYSTLSEYSVSELDDADDFDKKKMMVEKQQEKVLAKLNYKSSKKPSVNENNKVDLKLKHQYRTINGFSGKITKGGLEKLKNNPDVKRIYINGIKNITLDVSVPLINATRTGGLVYNGSNLTGAGETICVIDTGVDYNNTNLGGGWGIKIIDGYNTIGSSANSSCSSDNSKCFDDNGHGTHVIGTIISDDTTFRGVAPDANIVAIKACNSGGSCADADIIDGIDLCVVNATNLNISVISMSLGGGLSSEYCNDDSLAPAINTAVGQNISVVVASGNGLNNDGNGKSDQIASPACIQNATPIGAINDAQNIPSFSNRGNNFGILLFAPGVNINSTLGSVEGSGFGEKSGTSMATPHAAGTFALIHQYFKLTENKIVMPNETDRYLNDTGKEIVDGSNKYSRINIFAAILSLDTLAPNITFLSSTLANKSNSTNANFFINITANEVLANATLEFNGANETMEGSGLNWFKNKTLDSGAYLYKVWGNDSSGNMGLSELRLIQINNTAPNITSFFPSTLVTSIVEPNNQTFNITHNDIDGDVVTINWYRNSTLVSTSSEFNFTGNFTSAAFYNITVFVADNGDSSVLTWNFTIDNTNQFPTIDSVTINSSDFLNRTNGTLSGSFSTSDPENDVITANETKWYNNFLVYFFIIVFVFNMISRKKPYSQLIKRTITLQL